MPLHVFKLAFTILALLISLFLAACGGGSSTSEPPSTSIPESSQLQIVNTQHATGTKLGLKQPISVVLSFDADETTINATNVRLLTNEVYDTSALGLAVPGKVSYDPALKSKKKKPTTTQKPKRRY